MWLKVESRTPTHRKFVGLDPRAGWLWFHAWCWCGEHTTDGFIPAHVAAAKAQEIDPQQALLEGEHPLIAPLVARRLWHRVKGGYRVHHFLHYNPSANEIRERREAAVRAGAAGGRLRAEQATRHQGKFVPSDSPGVRQATTKRRTKGAPRVPFTSAPSGPFTSAPATVPDRTRTVPDRSVSDPEREHRPDDVARLTDLYRAIPGVHPTPDDGGTIAGLVKRHGAAHVEAVIRDADVSIGAATNPRQYLAGACRRPRTARTLEDDKAQTLRELAQFRVEGRL